MDTVQPPVNSDDSDFDLAFDAVLSGSYSEPSAEKPDAELPSTDEDVVIDAPESEVEPAVEPEPVKAEAPEVKPEPVKAEPAPQAFDVEKAIDDAFAKRAATEAKATESAQAEQQALQAEQFTAEEDEAFESVISALPEMKTVLDAVRRTAIAQVENKYSKQLADLKAELDTRIQPIQQSVEASALDEFDRVVLGAHPDAYDLVQDMNSWIDTKPVFMQAALRATMEKSTAQDAVALIDMFKAETQTATPVKPEAVTVQAQADREKKQQQLQQQEGIKGRQSSSTSAIPRDDYDSAFDRFAATK